MSRPHIRITVQLGPYPDARDKTLIIQLDEFALRESLPQIDYPSPDADVFVAAVFCTHPKEIREREYNRKTLSEVTSKKVAQLVAEMLKANDTVMGYRPTPSAESGSP